MKSKQVYVEFLDINKSTANDSDMLVIQLFATFDEAESRDKSRKIKIGLEQSAKRGRLFGNSNIYGYEYKFDEKRNTKILIAKEDEAAVIMEIFTLYSKGMGTRRIAKHLEDSGKRSRNGIPFSYSTIKGILKNAKYTGANVYNKYDRSGVFDTEKHATMRHFDEWIIQESDKIDEIISKELYYECKAILEGKKSHINNRGINRGKGEFAGLIYCAKCGATYNQTGANGRKFFMCSTKKKHNATACNSVNVSYAKMLEAVTSEEYETKLLYWRGLYMGQLGKLVPRLQAKLTCNNAAEIEDCTIRLAEHKRMRDKFIDLWKRRLYTDSELDTELAPLESEIIRLEEQLAFYAKTNADIENDIAEVQKTLDALRDFEIKEYYSQDEIISDIAKIIVYADGGIDFMCKAQNAMEKIRGKHGELFRALNEEQ